MVVSIQEQVNTWASTNSVPFSSMFMFYSLLYSLFATPLILTIGLLSQIHFFHFIESYITEVYYY